MIGISQKNARESYKCKSCERVLGLLGCENKECKSYFKKLLVEIHSKKEDSFRFDTTKIQGEIKDTLKIKNKGDKIDNRIYKK